MAQNATVHWECLRSVTDSSFPIPHEVVADSSLTADSLSCSKTEERQTDRQTKSRSQSYLRREPRRRTDHSCLFSANRQSASKRHALRLRRHTCGMRQDASAAMQALTSGCKSRAACPFASRSLALSLRQTARLCIALRFRRTCDTVADINRNAGAKPSPLFCVTQEGCQGSKKRS